MKGQHRQLMDDIRTKKELDKGMLETLKRVLDDFAKVFGKGDVK